MNLARVLVFAYVQIRGEALSGEEGDEVNQILQSIAYHEAAARPWSSAHPCVDENSSLLDYFASVCWLGGSDFVAVLLLEVLEAGEFAMARIIVKLHLP